MSRKNERRGVVETGLNFAIGGTALAVDKASELVRDAKSGAEDAIETARTRTEKIVDDVEETAKETAKETKKRVEHEVTGPDTRPYEERTMEELYELAAEREIEGRSKMRKEELIEALRA